MNVSFAAVSIEADEGDCTVILKLDKTEGALGPVSIQIFTVSGTAKGSYVSPVIFNIARQSDFSRYAKVKM